MISMKLLYKYVIILIVIYLMCCVNIPELFDVVSSIEYKYFEAPFKSKNDKSKPSYMSDLSYNKSDSMNCCLVEKKFLPPGEFKYSFNKLKNEMCDPKHYNMDSNKQLFIEGDNNWSNDMCNDNILGSCRWVNKECIDFVDKKICDKYKMTWSNRTCHNPLDYVWVDKTGGNRALIKPKDNGGTVDFFPELRKK